MLLYNQDGQSKWILMIRLIVIIVVVRSRVLVQS